MDFLNKLYESNYFGIGLFAVISFLVVTFLIVLFFGKKDEQKRKIENENNIPNNDSFAFKETTEPTPLVSPIPPVAPLNYEVANEGESANQVVTPNVVEPVAPVGLGESNTTLPPVEPIPLNESGDAVTPISLDNNVINNNPSVMPINDVVTPVEAPVAPAITPVVPPVSGPEEVAPISSNYSIPEEPIVKSIENPTPIINTPVEPVLPPEEKPILVEEPVINETYYQPTDVLEAEEVKMPNIDFDAIAKSISAELDELEKTNSNVKVTPINEITGNTPVNNSSSIYVNKPEMTVPVTHIDLPKKIDLPDRIDE